MDYLLGKSDKWMTCEDLDLLIEKKVTYGLPDEICDVVTMTDQLPEELRKPQEKPTGPR